MPETSVVTTCSYRSYSPTQLRADGLSIKIHEQEVTEDKRITQPRVWLANVDPAPVFPVFSLIQLNRHAERAATTTKFGRREYGRLLRANVEYLALHINSFHSNILHDVFVTAVSLKPI